MMFLLINLISTTNNYQLDNQSTTNFQNLPVGNNDPSCPSLFSWYEEMVKLHKAIEEYNIKTNGISRINLGVLALICQLKEFQKLVKKAKQGLLINPISLFMTKKSQDYLDQIDSILESKNKPQSPNVNNFIYNLRIDIALESCHKWRNWAYTFGFRGLKYQFLSKEDEKFSNLFCTLVKIGPSSVKRRFAYGLNDYTLVSLKDETFFITMRSETIKTCPKYLFVQKYNEQEIINQKDLDKIMLLKHNDHKYALKSIFLQNQVNLSIAILSRMDDTWATFGDNKYEFNYTQFSDSWHVTLLLYEKTK